MYNDNLFGHAIMKGDFIALDLDNVYNNTSPTSISLFTLTLDLLSGMLNLAMWV